MVLPLLLASAALALEPGEVEVHRIGLGYASAYLVRSVEGAILVDAGLGGSAGRILRAAKRRGVEPGDIRLIAVTHVHRDHAGGAAELARRTGAPIAVHAAGADHLARGLGAPVIPHTATGRAIAAVGRDHTLPAARAEVVVHDRLDLSPWGIPGFLLSTPGHTACSMSLVVPGQLAVVGDLVVGPRRKPRVPNLRELPDAILPSLAAVLEHDPEALWLGHVGRVDAERAARLVR